MGDALRDIAQCLGECAVLRLRGSDDARSPCKRHPLNQKRTTHTDPRHNEISATERAGSPLSRRFRVGTQSRHAATSASTAIALGRTTGMKAKILGTALGVGIMISSITGVAQVSAAPGTGATAGVASYYACDCETRYTTTDLNMRSGAGTNYDVILVMPAGVAVQAFLPPDLTQNGFVRVRYNDTLGWASTQYLSTSGGGNSGGNNGGSGGVVDGGSEAGITGTAFTTSSVNFRQGPGTN